MSTTSTGRSWFAIPRGEGPGDAASRLRHQCVKGANRSRRGATSSRYRGRLRLGLSADGVGGQVSRRTARTGLAVCFFPSSRLSTDPRSGKARRHHLSDKNLQHAVKGGVQRRQRQEDKLPCAAALVCDPPVRARPRYPNASGVARPRKRADHDDIYARAEIRRTSHGQSAR